jgi:PAS domain S-box-containing protein
MAVDDLSQRIIGLSRRIEELQQQYVSDPASSIRVLTDAMEELQISIEELSAADEELMRQNEELIAAQEALEESKEHYRTAIDFTYDWEYWVDPAGKYVYISPSCERISGYSADEFMQDQGLLERIIHPQDRPLFSDHLLNEKGPEKAIDFRLIARSGEERWISHICQPVYGSDGNYLGRRGSNRDITERKQAEQTVEYQAMLLGQVQDAVIGSDSSFCITYWNKSAELMFGFTNAEALGKTPLELLRPTYDLGERESIFEDLERKGMSRAAIRTKHKDGSEIIAEVHSTRLIDATGGTLGFVVVYRDITERKQMEVELERLASFPKINPNPIIEVDMVGRVHFLNPAADQLFPDLKEGGRNHHWLIDWEQVAQIFHRSKTGTYVRDIFAGDSWYQQSMHLVPGAQRIRIYGLNITERKRAEEALRKSMEELEVAAEELHQQNDELLHTQSALQESEEKYRTIVETANEGIWVVDSEIRTTYVNKRMAEMLGYRPEEMIGKRSSDFMGEEEKARLGLALERRRQGIKESLEFKFVRKDGSTLWALASAAPLRDSDGRFAGSLGMLTDITERKRAEESLQMLSRQRQLALDAACMGWWHYDPATGISSWDDRYKEIFGVTGYQSPNDEILKQLHPEDLPGVWAKVEAALDPTNPQPYFAEYRINRHDGSMRWIEAHGIAQFEGAGENRQAVSFVGTVADITERKQAEEELQKARDELELRVQERTAELSDAKENLEVINEELQVEISEHEKTEKELIAAKEEAEAAVEAKAAFLANMSHELRTPLNAVIGYSSILLDDNLTSEQKENIESIRNGGEALLAIISDILEFSRAEKERITLEDQPFSLKRCVEESMDMVAVHASQKGLKLSYTIGYGIPDIIIGDHGRLRQILANLLSNAVKFTDVGEVSVSVSSKMIEGNKRKITFAVKDTGIGMPQDKMDRLFEPFTQLEYVISRKRDGAGLGLAISRKLVELMGGEIWAESAEDKGSTFRFTIQAETIPGRHLDSDSCERDGSEYKNLSIEKPMSILVAEDNPSNQKVLVEMLKRLGYRPDAVADGIEVLQALQIRPYDLIFMDIRMPEMDGLTATKEIRKLWPVKGPRAVAITAFAMEGDRERCTEAGMDGYIAKPVKMNDLADVLGRYKSF